METLWEPWIILPFHTGSLSPSVSPSLRHGQGAAERERQTEKGTCLDKEIKISLLISVRAQMSWPDASAEWKNVQCATAQCTLTSKFWLVFGWSRVLLHAECGEHSTHFCRTGSHTTQHSTWHWVVCSFWLFTSFSGTHLVCKVCHQCILWYRWMDG